MDEHQNLSLLIKSKEPIARECWDWALDTLLEVLHFTRDPEESFSHCAKGGVIIIAFVAEIAWALACIGPVTPWIHLWLTHELRLCPAASGSSDWYRTWQLHCIGIVIGVTMGDAATFECWSEMCIRFGCDSDIDSPFSLGLYVCDLINSKLSHYHKAAPSESLDSDNPAT